MSETYSKRLAAVQQAMGEADVDLLLIGPSSDMLYLMGRVLPSTERFNALAVARKGKPVAVVPQLQAPLLEGLPLAVERQVWTEAGNPLALTADVAERFGARRIAVNGHFWASFLLPLQRLLPDCAFSDAAAVTAPLRLCKDAAELALLDDLGARFDAIWQDFYGEPLTGITERDVTHCLTVLARDHGFDALAWCDVGSGPNGASPLHHCSDRVIEHGDPVVIDFAAVRNGYYMDTCRTPVAGAPHPDFVAIYDVVNAAHDAAAAAIRPGVTAASVDAAARAVIAEAGHGEHFIHRVGHGLGIDAHEEPYLVAGNELTLAPGMVFSNEPGIYIPGRWGVRIENIMTVTETGGRSLNALGRELVVMA